MITVPAIEFNAFPKIPRLSRGVVVTEKIDGTNACVYVTDEGTVHAASRTRWITPEKDNYGFAGWVDANQDQLRELGPGMHFGEWYGAGIQRRYGLAEKRFALFNTVRWRDGAKPRPAICGVVPILFEGTWDEMNLGGILNFLREGGSVAVPGFAKPEGVVVFHAASGQLFKKLLEGDELPKGVTTYGERAVAAEQLR